MRALWVGTDLPLGLVCSTGRALNAKDFPLLSFFSSAVLIIDIAPPCTPYFPSILCLRCYFKDLHIEGKLLIIVLTESVL